MNFPADDIWPPDQPATRSAPRASATKTILGGLPAGDDPAEPGFPRTGREPIVVASPVQVATESYFDEPADADPLSWRSLRARIDKAVRKSPPLTVSISLHVIGLIMLAIYVIRGEPRRVPTLDMAFVSTEPAEEPGVTVEKEPEEPPEPEPVDANLPPVANPVVAPPQPAAEQNGPLLAGDSRVPAPVVGALLQGRDVGRREALVRAFGGTEATEDAVTRALDWLVRQQQADGLWSLKGPYSNVGSQENHLAATAMALIAFQGAGHLPDTGKHRAVVARAWRRLLQRQAADGRFDFEPMPQHHALYSHAQATIAVCELFGMTKNPAYEVPARRAIAYCLAAQGPNGGWRYQPGQDGDLSVTGWFMMALKSGQMAGINVPPTAFEGIGRLLDGLAIDGGARYGYLRNANGAVELVSPAMSAEGLLCRQYLGWSPREPRLVAGLEQLVARPLDFAGERDLYAWYYITQVAHHAGGTAWDRWNAAMRETLPKAQLTTGPDRGSWDPGGDRWGAVGGRLYATCFCTYMLEVYYRHLPLYAEIPSAGAMAEPPR
jgi:hypothetical protein